jgi:hypothetical protein
MTAMALAEVGLKAMVYQQAADARRAAFLACQAWKAENGHDRIERNARARLFRACRKAQT